MRRTLVDTGPLVALIDRGDADHERCVAVARRLRGELVTVWPVITEAAYLLADVPSIRALMRKYGDLPMDLADAALVRIAAREGINEVFTLDRHFRTYRGARGRPFVVKP